MRTLIYGHALLLSLAWTVIIFILCATPGQYIPSADWLELLSFDKLVHASIFFVLTALWFLTAIKYSWQNRAYVLCFLGALSYGLLLEWMQATCFSNRSADWKDMIANGFGCIMALVFLKKIRKLASEKSGG